MMRKANELSACVKTIFEIKMNFNKTIQSLSMLITLTFTGTVYSSNIDVGYKNGFALETMYSINDYVYIHTESVGDMYSYGAGLGYKNNYFTTTLTVDRVFNIDSSSVKTMARAMYNDRAISYFGSISYEGKKGMGYRIGAGYPLSEKLSLVMHYSNTGLFFGFRRWL